MQCNNHNQQNLARLDVCGAQHWVQIPEQEHRRKRETDTHKGIVERSQRTPGHESDGDPDQIGVAVQGPAFENVCGFATEPFERAPEGDGDEECVAVNETCRACCDERLSASNSNLRTRLHLSDM